MLCTRDDSISFHGLLTRHPPPIISQIIKNTLILSQVIQVDETDVVAATRLGNTLSVTGETDVVAATRLGNTLSVTGETDVVAPTRLGNTLSVTGATTLANTLSVSGETDVVAATRLISPPREPGLAASILLPSMVVCKATVSQALQFFGVT